MNQMKENAMTGFTRRDMLKMSACAGLATLSPQLSGCGSTASAAQPFSLRAPVGPTPVAQMGQTVYAYELYIGRALSLNLSITKVEIMADGVLVKTYEGSELSQCLITKMDPFSTDEALFTGRDYKVLLVWVTLGLSSPPPSRFSHRVYSQGGLVAEGGIADVQSGVTQIAPPIKGDRWWAANGPSNFDRHHRSCIIDVSFRCTIAQRFATDWMQFGADGRHYTGDGTRCTDYYCYGADLLAVADATVVEARDGIPEGVPPNNYAATTLQNVFGNSVILDIGDGRYAAYAHIIPGTVTVNIGDHVTTGQVIGKLGNSGNSTAPHLHFHLCNGRDGLASEGLPFSFAAYDLLGSMPLSDVEAGLAWKDPGTPQLRNAEMPMLDQVLRLY
jgi:murein DD-endopeptidase MepM/ murein hydrolase activator NlpD